MNSTERRAQSKGHRAQSTELRAQGTQFKRVPGLPGHPLLYGLISRIIPC